MLVLPINYLRLHAPALSRRSLQGLMFKYDFVDLRQYYAQFVSSPLFIMIIAQLCDFLIISHFLEFLKRSILSSS